MSRYVLRDESKKIEVALGWDPGLSTFFAQVTQEGARDPVLWVGTFDVIATTAQLEDAIAAYIELPEDVVQRLEQDRLNND